MQNKIEELKKLLPPPSIPRNNSGDWSDVERALGTKLPSDYKQFTELYGTVKICNYLVIHTAFPWSEESLEFRLTLNQEYDAVVDGRENIPFADYPTQGGLLPFGGTDSGSIFSWITEGDPDDWGVFAWIFPGEPVYTLRSVNLSMFLVDLLSESSPLFPDNMPMNFFSPENRRLLITN
jgi:hypothetical protein